MVAGTLVRMIGRRLALRKGLAVSAAVLLLLGWCLLYATTRDSDHTAEAMDDDPAEPSPNVRAAPVAFKKPLPVNLSHIPSHLRTPPPIPRNPHLPQQSNHSTSHSSSQCHFTEVTEVTHVDLQMRDLLEEIPFDNPNGGVWNQGFDITYSMDSFETEPLTVFVVPHSHNDPGWLRTFEEYYQKLTKQILDNMVEALIADSRRRFIWAEISFLDRWWSQCGQERRQKFRRLVEQGQLEIVTGGWVMNDEANTHYFAMTDQMIEGHTWLARNLPGVVPEIGWAIDPFGHTPSMAYLLQRMGLSGMLIQRVHYSVKKRLAQTRELEFLWRQAWDHHGNTDMLTHLMPFYSYDIPHTCGPDPSVCCQFDFKRLPGSKVKCPWRKPAKVISDDNVRERAVLLADQYMKKAQLYRTNTLLVPLGDDFRWDGVKEIEDQFVNYQRLMDYMNNHHRMRIKVQFGTLSEYFSAMRGSSWVTSHTARGDNAFPVLSGDFFTYSDREDHYWSGYFTSRPFYKHMDRQLECRLRLAEILFSLSEARHLQTYPTLPDLLTSARQNLALFQHHDGITGTAKDKVVVDYGQRMKEALDHTNSVIQHSSQALLLGNGIVADSLHFSLEESQNTHDSLPRPAVVRVALDGAQTALLVNPLTFTSHRMVYITVDTHLIMVTDADNTTVSCQINPVLSDDGSVSGDHYQLVFPATLPALGLVQYHIWPGTQGCTIASLTTIHYTATQPNRVFTPDQRMESQDIVLSTNQITATFSATSGLLKSVASGKSEVGVVMDVVTYGTRKGKDKSGAYLFLPDGEAQTLLTPGRKPHITVTTGPLVQEVVTDVGVVKVQQRLNNVAGEEGQSVSITTLTDILKEHNKEVALRLCSTVANSNGVFYTDLNGLQLVQRKTVAKLPLQGNFYPMPTMALLQDSTHRLSLLSAQAQGVASLKPGWLEVVLDRTLAQDDERGLGQGVKDNKLTAANFRLLVETRNHAAEASPQLAYPSLLSVVTMDTLLHPPHISFTSSKSKILPYLPSSHSLLSHPLPCDIFLLNLRSSFSRTDTALLLHRRGYDCNFLTMPLFCSGSNGMVELKGLFEGTSIATAREMFLSLLREKGAVRSAGLSVDIPPMEIQTYCVTWTNTK